MDLIKTTAIFTDGDRFVCLKRISGAEALVRFQRLYGTSGLVPSGS
jgi:hypothetical protein